LQHTEAETRAQAAKDLVFVSSSERPVAALAELLGDPVPAVRQAAGLTLFICGRHAEAAVPALIEALGDSEVVVQRLAAAALSMVGRPACAALPKLSELRSAADELLRTWVAEAERSIAS
jgi:HEAT repeat protein